MVSYFYDDKHVGLLMASEFRIPELVLLLVCAWQLKELGIDISQ